MDIATATPVEIDTELARIWGEEQRYRTYLASARERLGRLKAGRGFGRVEDTEAEIAMYEAKIESLYAEAEPYNAEWNRRGGWKRYFLVTNANGHVHRGMDCSTCYPNTQYAWLIELADCDEAAMVEEYGEKACTVCFPDAPANPRFYTKGAKFEAEQGAKAAAKAEREAKKAAKAIQPVKVFDYTYTDHRTQEKVDRYETLTTLAAAKRWLTDSQETWGSRKRPEDIHAVASAIATKCGTSVDEEIAAAKKRAAKRK